MNSELLKKTDLLAENKNLIRKGFRILGLSFSPIRGPEGNIEYLLELQKEDINKRENGEFTGSFLPPAYEALADNVIEEAHESFQREKEEA